MKNLIIELDLSNEEYSIIQECADNANLTIEEYTLYTLYEYIIRKEELVMYKAEAVPLNLVPKYATYSELLPIRKGTFNIIKPMVLEFLKRKQHYTTS